MSDRDYLMYLLGSAVVATVLSVGIGLIADVSWKPMLGGAMIITLFLYAFTVKWEKEKRDAAAKRDSQ